MNLLLRPFEVGDGAAVHGYWKSDPGWQRFNASVPAGFTESDAGDFVVEMSRRDRSERPNWALVHSDKVVGVVSLSFEEGHRAADIGYGIHADLRGLGLCAEAVRKILGAAFSEYPELDEVRARTHGENTASIRLLGKLGFANVSHLSDDGQTFRLLRSEWRIQDDGQDGDEADSGAGPAMTDKLRRLSTYLFVLDVAQSLSFYQSLGMETEMVSPVFGRALIGDEVVLELGASELTSSYDPRYKPPANESKGTINFELESDLAVDEKYRELVALGYVGHLEPINALWQARFAVVLDPNGNQVGLHGPRNTGEDRQREQGGAEHEPGAA